MVKKEDEEMNKRTVRMFLMLAMVILACACDLSSGGGGGGGASPTEVPANILFQDDFSNSASGWEVGEYDGGDVGYKDGAYFVTSTQKEVMMWGVANRSFDNVVIEVDAIQISSGADSDNAYGVVCRTQDNGDGYYLRISGDGYYGIAKAEGQEFVALVEWASSSAIHKGNATNRVRAVCNGSTLELFVNGQQVATAEDSTFTTGDVAFSATTYEEEMTEIHFDNLMVTQP
jgi:hypothetical protein